MIHFTCDCCGRAINQAEETRYVVRIEVYAAVEDDPEQALDDMDQLEEIEDLLERLNEEEQQEDLFRQVRYDLCAECRERFVRNPLGQGVNSLRFSDN